jgi:HK97 family phage prohead protease
MEYLTCHFESKASGDDGYITGYGSIFGNVDSYGDIVAPGAFKKSINDVETGAKSWPAMLLQHGGQSAEDQMPDGVWTKMEKDSNGLRLQGKLANTKKGRDAYALLKMKPRPALDGLSIGYRCTDYEMHKAGSTARRTIKAVDLVEVSLVTFPANTKATVLSVKSALHTEPLPEPMSMKDLARADFEMLRKELTKNNRSGW